MTKSQLQGRDNKMKSDPLGNTMMYLQPNKKISRRKFRIGKPIGNYPKGIPELTQEFADLHFKGAVAESHRLYYDVYSRWCRLNLREAVLQSKGKCLPPASRRLKASLSEKLGPLMDDVVWLVGGLLGRYDKTNNLRARNKAFELVKAAAVDFIKPRRKR